MILMFCFAKFSFNVMWNCFAVSILIQTSGGDNGGFIVVSCERGFKRKRPVRAVKPCSVSPAGGCVQVVFADMREMSVHRFGVFKGLCAG